MCKACRNTYPKVGDMFIVLYTWLADGRSISNAYGPYGSFSEAELARERIARNVQWSGDTAGAVEVVSVLTTYEPVENA